MHLEMTHSLVRFQSMLMFLAVVQLAHWYFHLPKMYYDLVDASTVNSVYWEVPSLLVPPHLPPS